MCLSDTLSFNAAMFLDCSPRQKEFFLYCLEQENTFGGINYASMKKFAAECGYKTERSIQKFLSNLGEARHLYITITQQFKNGRQTTNLYKLNNNFKNGMQHLYKRNLLNPSRKRVKGIIASIQRAEKVHPSGQKKFTLIKTSLEKSNNNTYYKPKQPQEGPKKPPIHHVLTRTTLPYGMQLGISARFSEAQVMQAIESYCWKRDRGGGATNPEAYVWGTLVSMEKKKKEMR